MGFRVRKSIKICKGVKVNLSKSGVSTSVKVGNVTHNTKRGTTVNLGNGVSYHAGNSTKSKAKESYKSSTQSINRNDFKNKWDKMTDKQIKNYNTLMKILLWMLAILSAILTIAIPPVILVSIISGIIAYKFDAKKMQTKSINKEMLEEELDIEEGLDILDIDTLNNKELLSLHKEEKETKEPEYQLLEGEYDLNKYTKVYSLDYSQMFNAIDIYNYKILHKDINVVGGWYRRENINEFADSIKNIEELELDIVLEKEADNEYDSNAIRVDAIYKVSNEIRKIQIGYLSREIANELKNIDELKASILKLDRLQYNDTTINIWVNEEKYRDIIKENELKVKQQEEYDKELEKIKQKSKISYEYNQLAMKLEKEGDIDSAIENYEKSIELRFEGNYPYDRLAILYRKRKDYDSEIRVLNQAINLFEFLEKATQRKDTTPKLEKFKVRLNRAIELKNKKTK